MVKDVDTNLAVDRSATGVEIGVCLNIRGWDVKVDAEIGLPSSDEELDYLGKLWQNQAGCEKSSSFIFKRCVLHSHQDHDLVHVNNSSIQRENRHEPVDGDTTYRCCH